MQQDDTYGTDSARFASNELLERVDGDEELMREVLGIYLEDTPNTLEKLKLALDGALSEDAAKAAHTLKGASANIAANRLRDHAYQIELKAKSGDLDGAAAIYSAIEAEFKELEAHLKRYLAE